MLLQVHDELVFDLWKEEEKEVREVVEHEMKTRSSSRSQSKWNGARRKLAGSALAASAANRTTGHTSAPGDYAGCAFTPRT